MLAFVVVVLDCFGSVLDCVTETCHARGHTMKGNDMTITELASLIGSTHLLRNGDGMSVAVTIVDMKSAYGTDRAVVTPYAGKGFATVAFDRLSPLPAGGVR